MITNVRPRVLVLRGCVKACGYVFNLDLYSESQARQRILSCWTPGARVFRAPDQLIVRLPKARLIQCSKAPGLPLVSVNQKETLSTALAATELKPDEVRDLELSATSAVVVRESRALVIDLENEEDPASWIDVSEFKLVSQPLPQRSTIASSPLPALAELPVNVRRELNIPPPSADLDQIVQQLQELRPANRDASAGQPAPAVRPMLNNFLGWLFGAQPASQTEQRGNRAGGDPQNAGRSRSGDTPGTRQPDWLSKLNNTMFNFLDSTGLLQLIEQRQAAYIKRMMNMFEQGDWDDALRHAIPLGGGAAEALRSLKIPSARQNLDISPRAAAPPSSSIDMPSDYFSRLRELYRNAFNVLANAGKIDEAAFVLLELLNEPEEAVSFLERHKRFTLAAQIAESRNLRPPLVVRLWLLAGDSNRAINIATLRNAFAEAVLLLHDKAPEQAHFLRLRWVHHLAGSGNYVLAARIAHEQLQMTGLARAWTKRAVENGGATAGQLLGSIWRRSRPDFPDINDLIKSLLDDNSREQAPARAALVRELLCSANPDIETCLLLRSASRSLLRDVGNGYVSFSKKQFHHLTQMSKDTLFQVDMQAASFPPAPQPLESLSTPLSITIDSGDVGANKIYDAVLLSNGRAFIALGEAGVQLISVDGKVLKRYNTPANQLIESDNGDRILCLAPRGPLKRVSRIDAITEKLDDLGEIRIRQVASSYNGSIWLAADELDRFMVMDGTAHDCKVLWFMPNLTGQIIHIARDPRNCSILVLELTDSPVRTEKHIGWNCDYPTMILRGRTIIEAKADTAILVKRLTTANGVVFDITEQVVNSPTPHVVLMVSKAAPGTSPSLVVQIERGTGIQTCASGGAQIAITNSWLALATGPICYLISLTSMRVSVRITLSDSKHLVPRLNEKHLVLCDELGRFIAIDLETGQIVRSFCSY